MLIPQPRQIPDAPPGGLWSGIVSTLPQRNRCRNHWKVLIVVGAYQILHTSMGELLS